jgi:hypothetical protein
VGFCRIFRHFSGFGLFLLSKRISSCPPAANANRWALALEHDWMKQTLYHLDFLTVVSPFYGLCEIFGEKAAIFGALTLFLLPYMAVKQNWRKCSF